MKPDTVYKLVQELKRRRVFRGVIVYGASTLILFEAADNLCNAFGIEAVPMWFVLLLGIGFIGSLWFSWIYDFTPGGIKKTEPAQDHQVPIPRKEVKAYQTTTFISVLIIIGLLTYNIIDGANKKKIQGLDKSIAVLPLHDVNLSPAEALDYEFIGREITSCLLKVKEYRVVPWEDCRKYKRKGKHYPEIGNDLSAAILVDWTPYETNVQKRLSVDLISAIDESLLWSDNFIIEGNWPTEICRHSRKISKKITRKLRTYLTPQERALIDEQPALAQASMLASIGSAITQDTWEMVQTGSEGSYSEKSEYTDSLSFDRAIIYFNEAIKVDPLFAEAYANRAKAKIWGIGAGFFNHSILDESREDIEKAFALHRDLPEAHIAMGYYYYYGLNEYQWALTSFEKAVEIRPGNIEYLYYLSEVHSTLGNWDEVQFYSNKVYNSNPRNVLFLTNLGVSFLFLHDFSRSINCQDRAIELKPQWYAPYLNKVLSLISTGSITEAREVLRKAKKNTGKEFYRTIALLDLYEGEYSNAIENIERVEESEYNDTRESEGDKFLFKAKIYKHAGNLRQATDYNRLAVDYFTNQILFNPEDHYAYSKLGIAYAALGMDQKAIESGQKSLENINEATDGIMDPYLLYNVIEIYALLGNKEEGLKLMNELLNKKSLFTLELIRLDPDLNYLLTKPG